VSDRLLRTGTAAAVLLVAFIAAVISFVHIQHLALTHGQTAMAAALLPLSIDGTVTASSLMLLRAARAHIPAPVLAQVMLVLSVLATLAANVAYGAAFGLTGALISGWPAVAFIGCAEMAITMARRAAAGTVPQPPAGSALAAAKVALEASVAAGYARTANSLVTDFGIGRQDAARLVKATSNGHAPEGR
jgi:hypothetical protein